MKISKSRDSTVKGQRERTTGIFSMIAVTKDKLRWKVGLARYANFWEQLWSALYLPLILGSLIVSLAWLGVFELFNNWVRISILVLLFIGFLGSLYPLFRVRFPNYQTGLNRVEAASGHGHRPLTALEDKLAGGNQDPASRILWNTHKKRMLLALKQVRSGFPHPGAHRRDPFGLRIIAISLLFIGYVVSEGERGTRLVEAFAGSDELSQVVGRIDAWVTPPAYTGRAPIYLTGDIGPARTKDAPITVPEGSIVVVRSQGIGGEYSVLKSIGDSLPVLLEGGKDPEETPQDVASGLPVELQTELVESSRVEIRDGSTILHAWNFEIVPDKNPSISFEELPEVQLSGSLKLTYRVTDDYGVVGAEAKIEADPDATELFVSSNPRPLVKPPQFALPLPRRSAEVPVAETFRNLTSHPWAGSNVLLTLSAEDERSQKGYSKPHKMTLPIRTFHELLARAIVEQRRILAMDANHHAEVIDAMDAILLAPHNLLKDSKYYPGMRFVYTRLVKAKTDKELLEVVDLLWELALTIEDGDLSVAERALRDAQEALRRALEEGASDSEISRLTQELREALQRYMQAMMQQMRNNPQAMVPMDPNMQGLSSQDLDQMLQQIEELAQSGARDAAQQLLSQMQQMLENMQTSQSMMMGSNETMRQMMQAMNQLGEMIRRQQELMDETFQLGQQGQSQQNQLDSNGNPIPGQSQQPMTPEEYAQALRSLQQQQGELAQQLQELMQQMQENGIQQIQPLGEANQSMTGAQQSIGRGDTGNAANQQGQALDALRRGAQQLGEQMRNQGRPGGRMMGRRPNEDPLGRPRRNSGPEFGDHVKVPEQIDTQRARQILEELRRRFSDPKRPDIELDYIERLLNPF